MIDPKLVMQLREMTGAAMMDAKKALEESNGNIDGAVELLRKQGAIKAAKKAERATGEGMVHSYIHASGKLGAMVEVLCETDFVARNEQFKNFVHDIAMQIAAANPLYVSPSEIAPEILEKEKELARHEFEGSDKPQAVVDKIVEGKMEKYFAENCLLKQPFIKDEDVTIDEHLKNTIAKIGENIQIKRFARFSIE